MKKRSIAGLVVVLALGLFAAARITDGFKSALEVREYYLDLSCGEIFDGFGVFNGVSTPKYMDLEGNKFSAEELGYIYSNDDDLKAQIIIENEVYSLINNKGEKLFSSINDGYFDYAEIVGDIAILNNSIICRLKNRSLLYENYEVRVLGEGLIAFRKDESQKWSVMNSDGKVLAKQMYMEIGRFADNKAIAKLSDEDFCVIDNQCEKIKELIISIGSESFEMVGENIVIYNEESNTYDIYFSAQDLLFDGYAAARLAENSQAIAVDNESYECYLFSCDGGERICVDEMGYININEVDKGLYQVYTNDYEYFLMNDKGEVISEQLRFMDYAADMETDGSGVYALLSDSNAVTVVSADGSTLAEIRLGENEAIYAENGYKVIDGLIFILSQDDSGKVTARYFSQSGEELAREER